MMNARVFEVTVEEFVSSRISTSSAILTTAAMIIAAAATPTPIPILALVGSLSLFDWSLIIISRFSINEFDCVN